MTHGHAHHPSAPGRYDRAFRLGIAMNLAYVAVEAASGIAYNSLALLSDAGHNLSDVIALVIAWGASVLSGAAPTEKRTYGMKRATVLASLVSAVALCVALGAIVWESLARLADPPPASALTVAAVAGVGVVVNLATAALFMSGRHTDLNIKSAYLHMAADAAVSLGVVAAGVLMYATGWDRVDPVIALVVAAVILVGGVGLLRESLDLAMDAVPGHVDVAQVRRYLESLPGVHDVHHLHIWAMSTTETALTVHLVVDRDACANALLRDISATLAGRFRIGHPTVQVEQGATANGCVYSGGSSPRTP